MSRVKVAAVDDSLDQLTILKMQASDLKNVDITVFSTGEEFCKSPVKFDLVLIDLLMDGVSGWDLVDCIERAGKTPIIFIRSAFCRAGSYLTSVFGKDLPLIDIMERYEQIKDDFDKNRFQVHIRLREMDRRCAVAR